MKPKPHPPTEDPWSRLARLAARAPSDVMELPFGFATRVSSTVKAGRRESTLAALEWLTIRGLAVALVIFAGSAAFGFDTVADVLAGEASLVGGWLDILPL